LLRNRVVDFVEICNVCTRKAIIKAAKRITNSDKMCRSYSDLNFGVTFFGTQWSSFYSPKKLVAKFKKKHRNQTQVNLANLQLFQSAFGLTGNLIQML